MAWLAVNKGGSEFVFERKPTRGIGCDRWCPIDYWHNGLCYETVEIQLPKGTIERLIGKKMTWRDEPVKITSQTLIK